MPDELSCDKKQLKETGKNQEVVKDAVGKVCKEFWRRVSKDRVHYMSASAGRLLRQGFVKVG